MLLVLASSDRLLLVLKVSELRLLRLAWFLLKLESKERLNEIRKNSYRRTSSLSIPRNSSSCSSPKG
jgi:hypothetical protein